MQAETIGTIIINLNDSEDSDNNDSSSNVDSDSDSDNDSNSNSNNSMNEKCGICECEEVLGERRKWLGCDECTAWYHANCLDQNDRAIAEQSLRLKKNWFCPVCRVVTRNDKWTHMYTWENEIESENEC